VKSEALDTLGLPFYIDMRNNFNGKVLGKDLWGKGLDSSDKILIDEIIQLGKQSGGCYATDEHFAELLEESLKTVSRRIQKLKKSGRIFVTTKQQGKKSNRTIKFISYSAKEILPIDTPIEVMTDGQNDHHPTIKTIIPIPVNITTDGQNDRTPMVNLYDTDGQNDRGILHINTTAIETQPRQEVEVSNTGPKEILDPEKEKIDDIKTPLDLLSSSEGFEARKIGTSTEQNLSIPDFLLKGIMYEGQMYFPMDGKLNTGQMTTHQLKQMVATGKEINKIITAHQKMEEKILVKNRDIILEQVWLAQHKKELMGKDNQAFLDYLNQVGLPTHQKKIIRPSTSIIRKFINEAPFYQQAIKNIKLRFGF
jgi:hypothetical protein